MVKVNVGIIGAGRIGRIHAANLVELPGVNVKSISDIHIDDVRQWAEGLGITNMTINNNDILQDPDIDAILICSTTDTHAELINRSVQAGKHIFCEKPISLDIDATSEAMRIVKEGGVKFQVGFNRRFDPNFARIKKSIAAGEIGETHIIKITSRDPEPPPYEYLIKSGGIFTDMCIHDFDMIRYLSGSEVQEVYVQGAVNIDQKIGSLGDIDTAVITLRCANGVLGVIDNSRRAVYGYDQRVEVFGSKGSVTAHNDFPNSVEWATTDGVYRDNPKYFFLERYEASYKIEVQSFIRAIMKNEATLVNEQDAFQAELIAQAAQKSYEEKRPVNTSEALLDVTA